jgi:cyclic lactone autoinducer peptide
MVNNEDEIKLGGNIMKKMYIWVMKVLSCMALMIAVSNVNSACFFNCYQPEIPDAAKKFKK